MLLTPHVLVGVAIAKTIPNPIIAVVVSVAMHFLGDKVPHWDFYSNTPKEKRLKGWRPIAVMAEFGLAVAVGLTLVLYFLWVQKDPNLALRAFLCGIAAVLPDALEAPHIFTDSKFKFVEKLTKIQSSLQTQAPLPWGLITQLLIAAVSLFLIF